jgi:TonB family protein
MKRIKFKKTISISFLLSLLIHGVIALILILDNTDSLKKLATQNKPVEVELLDASKFLEAAKHAHKTAQTPDGQIVQQDEKALNDEVPVNTRFLSRHNQVVKQQEQAAVNGKYKNSDETAGEKTPKKVAGKMKDATVADEKREDRPDQKTEQKAEQEAKQFVTSEDGIDAGLAKKSSKLKAFMPSFRPTAPELNAAEMASGGGEGPSATDDHLKDVKTGMQTVLSTREFLYYSYYNRIRSKLTQYWQPKIKEKMERIMKQGRTIASSGDKITRIVIILDEKGILRKVQVLGASGVSDLDDAAVEAFRQAAPFPNPPKGMVDSDGTIKIRWDFVLEA